MLNDWGFNRQIFEEWMIVLTPGPCPPPYNTLSSLEGPTDLPPGYPCPITLLTDSFNSTDIVQDLHIYPLPPC